MQTITNHKFCYKYHIGLFTKLPSRPNITGESGQSNVGNAVFFSLSLSLYLSLSRSLVHYTMLYTVSRVLYSSHMRRPGCWVGWAMRICVRNLIYLMCWRRNGGWCLTYIFISMPFTTTGSSAANQVMCYVGEKKTNNIIDRVHNLCKSVWRAVSAIR